MEKWKWIFTRTHTFKQSHRNCEDEQWRVADRSDWTSAGNEAVTVMMMMMKMKRKMKVWMSAGDEDVDHADDDED